MRIEQAWRFQCAWCKKLRVRGLWLWRVRPISFLWRGKVWFLEVTVGSSASICPVCRDHQLAMIEMMKKVALA